MSPIARNWPMPLASVVSSVRLLKSNMMLCRPVREYSMDWSKKIVGSLHRDTGFLT